MARSWWTGNVQGAALCFRGAALLWGSQAGQDKEENLLNPILLPGLFIFPNSWKFCKSCFCPLLFKHFCFWRKGKWKSIFKCILHFFCCCTLCSVLGPDNELTDVLGSLGWLFPSWARCPGHSPGVPACPSPKDRASPASLHSWTPLGTPVGWAALPGGQGSIPALAGLLEGQGAPSPAGLPHPNPPQWQQGRAGSAAPAAGRELWASPSFLSGFFKC